MVSSTRSLPEIIKNANKRSILANILMFIVSSYFKSKLKGLYGAAIADCEAEAE